MKKSETGAGQVGLLWVVFLMVLVLGLAGFAYIAFKDKASLEKKYEDAKVSADANQEKFENISETLRNLTKVVGFRDETIAVSYSSKEAIGETLLSLKDKYPDYISDDAGTLQKLITGVEAAYSDVTKKLAETRQNFENEVELRRTAEGNVNTIEDEKNNRITELEAQLNDEQQRAQSQLDEDNQRISNLQAQLDEAEGRVREAENSASTLKERLESEINKLSSRISAQAKKLEVLREPDLPDGSVLNTSSGSQMAYIDIGRIHGLRRGTKFEVFRYGKGGELLPKGWLEVRDVEKDTALCGILDTVDRFDPIVNGDILVNPHFVRNMEKTFVFLGDFPASLSKGFVKERLTALGAKVDEKISSRTDILVLGDKERGEFAPELVDTSEYKLADQFGVQIMRVNELAAYIEY